MKNQVIIIVPVYKKTLSAQERISLRQLRRVLGHYPICFAAPESLVTDYDGLGTGIRWERWEPECFVGVEAYSRLLMSRAFYERFSDFEYVFIYQLDGFVFSDRLREFCEMGYDYIGAPIPRSCWPGMPGYVGNGGVSLRRVQSMLQLLSRHEVMQMPKKFHHRRYYTAEDAIFSYWLAVDRVYRLPSVNVAAEFALDQDVQHRFSKLSDKNLPFACHGWQRAVYPVWKRFIEAQGYDLTDLSRPRERFTIRMRLILEYLGKRLSARKMAGDFLYRMDSLRGIVNQAMPPRKIAVWGYGRMGKKVIAMLEKLGFSVDAVYDEKAVEVADSKIVRPCRSRMTRQRHLVLIASSLYETEIAETMKSWGLLHGWNYLAFDEFLLQLGRSYLSCLASGFQNQ